MSTLREQLVSSPELEEEISQLRKVHLRKAFIATAVIAYPIGLWAAFLGGWDSFLILSIPLTGLIAGALWRFFYERQVIQGFSTAVGTVLVRKVGPGPKRGVRIQYGFEDRSGRMFIGGVGGSVMLPSKDQPIAIAYKTSDPEISMPLKSFWFYEFIAK